MITDKHYVGEVNTEILVDCGKDINSASVHEIVFKKPDGTTFTRNATIWKTTYLRYFTQATDFDKSGEYELQSHLTIGSWSGYGETAQFIVYERFS